MKVLSLFLLSALVSACGPVDTPQRRMAGDLSAIQLENLKAIPSEYGNLVAVTKNPEAEGWAQLWFVDAQNTIRMVRLEFRDKRLGEVVLVIPRS